MAVLIKRPLMGLCRNYLPYVLISIALGLLYFRVQAVLQLNSPPNTIVIANTPLNAHRHEACSAHGWRPFSSLPGNPRKVYDLFMLNSELDWLEIRLNTLEHHVDYFVIVESNITFTGHPKPLHFDENWSKFSQFLPKIIYHQLENPPIHSRRTWDYEDHQRNAMFTQVIPQLAGSQAANLGDVLLISDIDEIPRPETFDLLRACNFNKRLTLQSRFYYYGFQFLHKGAEWAHPQATIYNGPKKTILPADLRNGEGGWRVLSYFQKANLANASWHCSSCFSSVGEMLNKMASFSHTTLNREVFRSEKRIVGRVRKGLDLWDRPGEEYEILRNNTDVPSWVEVNRESFGYLLDREGEHAGFVDYSG